MFIFRPPVADPAKPRLRADEATGTFIFARGKISHANRPLRKVAPGDAPFYLPASRTLDLRGGGLRSMSPQDGAADLGPYSGGLFDLSYFPVTY